MDKKKKKSSGIQNLQDSSNQSNLTKRKKIVFTIITILIPILFFVTFETILRVFGFGNDLQLFFKKESNGEKWIEINPNVAQRYFVLQPDFARQAEESRVLNPKPENSVRIICLGGSTMAGFPYNKNATMPGILRTYLKKLLPSYKIEVINLGIAATNSFTVRDLMNDVVKLQPDAILVYSGHNEFYGALGVGSTFSLGRNRNLINGYLKLIQFRTVRFLQLMIEKIYAIFKNKDSNNLSIPVMQQMAKEQEIPYNSQTFKLACKWFNENLSDVVKISNKNKIPVFIGNLVSNLKNQPPFISQTNQIGIREKEKWNKYLNNGLTLFQTNSLEEAKEELTKAFTIDSADANVNYYLAKCELEIGNKNKASKLFSRARDLDLLRFRAPDTLNTIIGKIAQSQNIHLVDVFDAFKKNSLDSIIGNEHISEHLHPKVSGYILMAKEFLYSMQKSNVLPDRIDEIRISNLPQKPKEIFISNLDQEIGRQRIFHLTAEWPFKNQINLAVEKDEKFIQEAASKYINRQVSWMETHLNVAEKYNQLKLYDKALFEYQILMQEYPDEHAFFDRAGDVLIAQKKYNTALNYFSQSIKLDSSSPFARAGFGKTLMFLGRFREAESAFSEAMQLNKRQNSFSKNYHSFILYLWGGALVNLKKYTIAEEKFVEAIQLDPNNQLAKNFLSDLQQKINPKN